MRTGLPAYPSSAPERYYFSESKAFHVWVNNLMNETGKAAALRVICFFGNVPERPRTDNQRMLNVCRTLGFFVTKPPEQQDYQQNL